MSQIKEYVKIALMNIKSNKGRSILTMLGIIIGISSVIMIISIGNGIKDQVNGELNDMFGGQIYIYSLEDKDGKYLEFTQEDFDALAEKVPHVKGVTPQYNLLGKVSARKGSFDAVTIAGTPSMEFTKKNPIIKGKYFTEADYYAANKVCVIPEGAARSMFGTTDVIGMDVEISFYGMSQELTIIGIREDSASSMDALFGYGTGTIQLEIPISIMEAFGFYIQGFEGVYVLGDGPEYSADIAKACVSLLESRHNVRGENLITIQDFNDSMTQINSVLGYITIFVVFVAAISLLVGGIGVMNIMLVSVTERTREIGIRKALGARTKSIMIQFLSESAIITLVGGLIGICLGILGAVVICTVIGFTAQIQLSTILGASFFSSAVGIFFGIYPAKKAARLSPIEALRHE